MNRYFSDDSVSEGGSSGHTTTSATHMITNGFCAFSPTSTKGKWIFTAQTLILSFVPIIILLAQNGYSFYDMMKQKEQVMHKADLVNISKFYKPLFSAIV